MLKKCQFCLKEIEVKNGKVFSNHVRWCDKNPNYLTIKEKFKAKLNKIIQDKSEKRFKEYKENPRLCVNCLNPIPFECKERFKYCKRPNCIIEAKRFAESFCNRDKIRELNCYICDKVFITKSFIGKMKCSSCRERIEKEEENRKLENIRIIKERSENLISTYRTMSLFKFSLKDFPDEFDFDLIRKYGFYSPKNKKNNLGGVSRDHLVSVKYGFENNVDPRIIGHPANCELRIHNENISKGTKCKISLEDLMERIKRWDIKYKKIDMGS